MLSECANDSFAEFADASTHSPVGHFLPAQGMKPMSECSAVTHSDSRPKKAVNLVWQAPSNHPGQVIFRYGKLSASKGIAYRSGSF